MNVNNVTNQATVTNHTTVDNTTKKSDVSFNTYIERACEGPKEVSLNDIFEKAAQTYNVPVNLLKAIGYAESSFRVDATSHCGAQGIMQLMPGTAKSLGVTDAYDPEQNIMGGAKYIADKIKLYDGDIKLALAAYNAGSGNVKKYGGIPPFKETQNYVVKVMDYMTKELDADKKVIVGGSYSSVASTISSYTPVFEKVSEEEVITLQDRLNEIFSYDQYELFLKVLQEDEEKEKNNSEQYQDSSFTAINMNPAIQSLIQSTHA